MDGNFNYLSPSIINVLGYSQDEFIGHYTEYITDSSINRDVEEHTKAGLRGEKQDPYEAEYRHKNGSRVNLKVTEVPIFDDNGNVLGIEGIVQDITELKRAEAERESFIKELEKALTEIKTLKGLIPICANCKKIRDDRGYWNQIEEYIQEHSEAKFSHGICQDCAKKLYPDLDIYGDDL
jgi:PAS domain S-box-containing protein